VQSHDPRQPTSWLTYNVRQTMKTLRRILPAVILACGLLESEAQPVTASDVKKLECSPQAKEALTRALEDFELVLEYRQPRHAKRMNPGMTLFDGGTTWWQGEGYLLEIASRVCTIGKWRYLMYGPIITFENSVIDSNEEGRVISSVRLHDMDQLRRRLRESEEGRTRAPEPTAPSSRGSP
jgi:hypothetical protein